MPRSKQDPLLAPLEPNVKDCPTCTEHASFKLHLSQRASFKLARDGQTCTVERASCKVVFSKCQGPNRIRCLPRWNQTSRIVPLALNTPHSSCTFLNAPPSSRRPSAMSQGPNRARGKLLAPTEARLARQDTELGGPWEWMRASKETLRDGGWRGLLPSQASCGLFCHWFCFLSIFYGRGS